MRKTSNPFAYPAKVIEQDGSFVVFFRDIPEAITFCATKEAISSNGIEAIRQALCAYVSQGQSFPTASAPIDDEVTIELPLSLAVKIALHDTMVANRVRQADLARSLEIPTSEAARIVNPKKPVKIDAMVAAVRAAGGSVSLTFMMQRKEPARNRLVAGL